MSTATRTQALALALALPFALALAGPAAAQQSPPELEIAPLVDNLHVLTGGGGNILVATGPEATFLVDDQVAPVTDQVRARVASVAERPIDFVLNTHWHHDHTGGNEVLGDAGAWLVAQENVRSRMQVRNTSGITGTKEPSPEGALPVLTFPSEMTLHLNGDTIRALHVPHAHTDGDSIVHFVEDDVIHTGDVLFNGHYPYIDVWSGGSIDGMIAALEKVVEMAGESTRIVPGHGPVGTRQDVVRSVEMLRKVRAAVAEHVEAGDDLETTLAAGPTRDLDEEWAWGFISPERMVTTVWKSLAEPPAGGGAGNP